ncbi:cell division protein FtsA [Patescibacteria group bacterium]|nr:cell division protein FtsA [Patescibacteria group bacterium]MBU1246916.1 cell division protein FtsA [Patescibacteria group bacterium]MBU1519604.1 cell division protein FtsA [Patescibacteria group bacterium]MBU1730647.1 cell division protein FtsA [Patescibacteria group bacterium]MBU1956580.1 cell division protein FtsA [Patescibacteria group bacterium]
MKRNIVTGIDIGTNTTRVIIAEISKNSGAPHIVGMGRVESKGMRSGYVVNINEITKSVRAALNMAEKESGIRVRNVFLSIGGIGLESVVGHGSVMISRADNEVTDMDIEKVTVAAKEKLALTNKRIIETVPVSYKLDNKEVYGDPVGLKGSKLEAKILFTICFEPHLDDIMRATEDAGVEVEDVISAPIAASLVALTKRQRVAGCLLANIGAETVSIAVFENDIPISLEVFLVGSTDITNDIALGFQIPLEEAENMKMEKTQTFEVKKLNEIIEARLADIFELIELHLKKIDRNGLLPAGIIITGGGAGIATIEDFAKSALVLPSKIAHMTINDHENGFQDSLWFVAYGLCIFGFNQTKESPAWLGFKKYTQGFFSWFKQFLP